MQDLLALVWIVVGLFAIVLLVGPATRTVWSGTRALFTAPLFWSFATLFAVAAVVSWLAGDFE